MATVYRLTVKRQIGPLVLLVWLRDGFSGIPNPNPEVSRSFFGVLSLIKKSRKCEKIRVFRSRKLPGWIILRSKNPEIPKNYPIATFWDFLPGFFFRKIEYLEKKLLKGKFFFYMNFLIIWNELIYQTFSRLEVILTVSVIYRVDFLIKSDRWNIDDSSLDRTWNRSDFSRSKIKKNDEKFSFWFFIPRCRKGFVNPF